MAVLKLSKHDENREIEFELKYLLSLTTRQRFQMMFKKTQEMRRLAGKYGYGKTTQIIKRT
ncbi:MAG: hypothetical protein A3G91_04555 [Omnitrophica WOR_2 bacterium RIFCSPLOWO2_12_FULL_50_9]|nr:MAG: hypothetical protein A3D87_03805 [Omnitrophica WOR_2 bacterium RIFCSPHIGHO2_02_FULL_50_17]OGX40827.1 MAG: hypothetical protein A3G91_04555 [Omnitrophica WOR_2 bacterium RIFCSPLOWO2_12_FULL_50_9]